MTLEKRTYKEPLLQQEVFVTFFYLILWLNHEQNKTKLI